MKTIKYALLPLICITICSCVTSYDRYGRPIQTVDPVVATVGAVAVGTLAYNAGQNNSYYNNRYYGSNRYNGRCDRSASFYTTGRRFYHAPNVYRVRGNHHIYNSTRPSCGVSPYRRY